MTFLKWAGGKSRLAGDVLPHLPDPLGKYFEPFVGGGGIFFSLAAKRPPRVAILSDANPHLVTTYRAVKGDVDALVKLLRKHAPRARDEDYFYELRDRFNDPAAELEPTERAAFFIYLNKTCFNGLYRVDRKGRFNVPFGRYANPRVLDEERLRACSSALQRATILCADFEDVAGDAKKGDAVYFDPPYLPINETSFVAYGADRFSAFDHRRLAALYHRLSKRGARCLLSSSDCAAARRIYRELELIKVRGSGAINCDGLGRRAITDLLAIGIGKASRSGRSTAKPIAASKA